MTNQQLLSLYFQYVETAADTNTVPASTIEVMNTSVRYGTEKENDDEVRVQPRVHIVTWMLEDDIQPNLQVQSNPFLPYTEAKSMKVHPHQNLVPAP